MEPPQWGGPPQGGQEDRAAKPKAPLSPSQGLVLLGGFLLLFFGIPVSMAVLEDPPRPRPPAPADMVAMPTPVPAAVADAGASPAPVDAATSADQDSGGEGVDASDGDGPDPFITYAAARWPDAEVSRFGVYVYIGNTNCSRRMLESIGRMSDAPDLLRQALALRVQFLSCASERTGETTTHRWPFPGVVIPQALEWHRRYVVTPPSRRYQSQLVWCFDTDADRGPTECYREMNDCIRNSREVAGFLNPDPGSGIERVVVLGCMPTTRLWCFETGGSEQQCRRSPQGCERYREAVGFDTGPCEVRNAL